MLVIALAVLVVILSVGVWYNGRGWDRALRARNRLSNTLAGSHMRHAGDNEIYQRRERAARALLRRVTALLDSALAARDYGDKPDVWEKHWQDIEEARALSAVFPAE